MSSREARNASREKARSARAHRAERYEAFFAPWTLAAAGAIVSVAYLFQRNLPLKAAFFSLFLAAALLSGKKVSFLATVLVSLGIVAANLVVPVGTVLWHIGAFRITRDALLDGINKALTFEGLIYISKASIRPGLRLPGRFGSIVARAFVYYDRILEYRGKVRVASLFQDADALMLAIWESREPDSGLLGSEAARPGAGYAVAFGISIFALSALVAGFFLQR